MARKIKIHYYPAPERMTLCGRYIKEHEDSEVPLGASFATTFKARVTTDPESVSCGICQGMLRKEQGRHWIC